MRKALNLIDHLPRASYFVEAVSNDEEYAALLASSKGDDSKPRGYRPPMHAWTQEAQMLAVVIDKLSMLQHTLVAVNSKKAGSPPQPFPVPRTALEGIDHRRKMEKHQSLVDKLLPRKAASAD